MARTIVASHTKGRRYRYMTTWYTTVPGMMGGSETCKWNKPHIYRWDTRKGPAPWDWHYGNGYGNNGQATSGMGA